MKLTNDETFNHRWQRLRRRGDFAPRAEQLDDCGNVLRTLYRVRGRYRVLH
jgi:hypothetical protein